MKEIVWTPAARRSLRRTSEFILDLWNEDVRREFIIRLNFRIAQIQKNPRLAPAFENGEIRQLIIHKNVSLFYTELPDKIRLLLIWDNRQNPDDLLKKLLIAKK